MLELRQLWNLSGTYVTSFTNVLPMSPAVSRPTNLASLSPSVLTFIEKTNELPTPGKEFAVISPESPSQIYLQIESPIPLPDVFLCLIVGLLDLLKG